MKKAVVTFGLSIFMLTLVISQPFYTTLGNNNHLTFGTNGYIWAESVSPIFSKKPTTLFSGGIWLVGIGRNSSEFKAAAHTYLNSGVDYISGPCDPALNEDTRTQVANQFNKIWKVTATDITAHILDMKDGKLDFPISSIMAWPAKGNPFFTQYNFFENPFYSRDLAPFKDTDQDGIYDPTKGDYPVIHQADEKHQPDEIFWSVFNDATQHTLSKAKPLNFEIQQTGWNYNCANDALLSNINFLSYKITNYSTEAIDSLFMGYWVDPDIGCYQDDAIGSAPAQNAFYAYNYDDTDGDVNKLCPGGAALFKDDEIPAYSIKFLNEEMVSFMNLLVNKSSMFYNIMNGTWDDGLPMTRGGDGYNLNGKDITKFAFDGNPNDTTRWSMRSAKLGGRDIRGIGNTYLEKLLPLQYKTIDMAFTLHYDKSKKNGSEQIDKMYLDFPKIQNYYDKAFKEENCVSNECSNIDCVYPGDTNNDGIVNIEDCLSVFINNGKTGNARDGSLLWAPKNAKDWSDKDINGLNNKYSDCDGNGVVNFDTDKYIIDENFGKTHSNYVYKADKYIKGNEIFVKKQAIYDSLNITRLSGSFPLVIEHKFIDTTVWAYSYDIEFDGSLLNVVPIVASSSYEFSKNTPNEFHYAANSIRSKSLKFTFLPEIIADGKVPYDCTQLKFKNIKVVRKDGAVVSNVGARDVQLCFNKNLVSNQELSTTVLNATCYPNPITANALIDNKTDNTLDFELLDVNGRLITNGKVNMQSTYSLDFSDYTSGVYLLLLKDKQQNQKQLKLVKI